MKRRSQVRILPPPTLKWTCQKKKKKMASPKIHSAHGVCKMPFFLHIGLASGFGGTQSKDRASRNIELHTIHPIVHQSLE
jgi:hypothetical protein